MLGRVHGITLPLQQANLNFNVTYFLNKSIWKYRSQFLDVFATSNKGHLGCLVTCVSMENIHDWLVSIENRTVEEPYDW